MAVTYVDQADIADQLISNRQVFKPGGVTTGDLAVFFLHRWDSGGSFPNVTGTASATALGTPIVNGPLETRVYLKFVAAETSWTFSWTGARWSSLSAIFFRGVDPALTLSSVPFNTATGTGTSIGTTSVTTVADAGLAWSVNTHDYVSITSHAPPTGYTEVVDWSAFASGYRISTGTSESAASSTIDSSQVWIAALVAVAPVGAAGPVALDAKGSAAAQAAGTSAVDRPIAGTGSAGADAPGSLSAARPVAGQGTAAAGTTATVGTTRAAVGSATAAAAVSGEATFERGLVADARAGTATTASLSVARMYDGAGNAASASSGSLVGGLVDLAADARTASAITGLATFTRGLGGSGNAASQATGAAGLGLAFAGVANAGADVAGDLTLVRAWYRLVVPQIVEYFTMRGSLRTSMVREVTVFGDENGLFTSELGAIPEGGDEYGAIPFGTKYIWYGGHENLTDDPAIRDLWLSAGFEVEVVSM